MSIDISLDKCRASLTLESRHPYFTSLVSRRQSRSTQQQIELEKGRWKLSHKSFCGSFRRREFGTDDAPTARRMPAPDNALRTCPKTCSALPPTASRRPGPGKVARDSGTRCLAPVPK